jgi:hypothetical protein
VYPDSGGPSLFRFYCLPCVVCSPPRRQWPGRRYLRVPPAGQPPVRSCCTFRFVCRDGHPVAPNSLATQTRGIPYPQTYCFAARSPLCQRSNIGSLGRIESAGGDCGKVPLPEFVPPLPLRGALRAVVVGVHPGCVVCGGCFLSCAVS